MTRTETITAIEAPTLVVENQRLGFEVTLVTLNGARQRIFLSVPAFEELRANMTGITFGLPDWGEEE